MFVGLDLLVGRGESYHPIHHVDRDTAVIKVYGELQSVPLKSLRSFQTKRSTKVGRRALTISKLDVSRAQVAVVDPVLEQMVNQSRLMAVSMEVQEQADRRLVRTDPVIDPRVALNDPAAAARAATERAAAMAGYAQATDFANRLSDARNFTGQLQEASQRDVHDGISLRFRVESNEWIPEAYLVLIAEVFDPISPVDPKTFVVIRNIGVIEPGGKNVRMVQGGFPPGFQLLNTRMHMFSRGQELGTNLSEKIFPLRPGELREYLALEHATSRASGAFHPEPVWATAPAGFLATLTPDDTMKPVEIEVDAEGRVRSLKADGLSRSIQDVLFSMWFRPAVENGQPVPGRIAGQLGELLP